MWRRLRESAILFVAGGSTLTYTEQRRHPRLPVLVDCRVEGASGRHEIRLTDLSPGGCFVDTSMSFPAGALITLHAMLGDSEVSLIGRVVPVSSGTGFGFAIDLEATDPLAREQLEAYIKDRSQ